MDTLTRMRSFADVVRSGGYSAAARATGRSKAILSKDVRELENWLGVRLLTRTTRSVALAESGQTYFDEAVELVANLDELQERIREQGDTSRGPLRISAPRTCADGKGCPGDDVWEAKKFDVTHLPIEPHHANNAHHAGNQREERRPPGGPRATRATGLRPAAGR